MLDLLSLLLDLFSYIDLFILMFLSPSIILMFDFYITNDPVAVISPDPADTFIGTIWFDLTLVYCTGELFLRLDLTNT